MDEFKKILVKFVKIVIIVSLVALTVFTIIVIVKNIEADKWSKLLENAQALIPKETPKEKQEDTIKRICDEEGVPWIQCILVAQCESKMDKFFKEKIMIRNSKGIANIVSYDRGIFAINSYHYKQIDDECSFNIECATKVFAQSVKNGKGADWLCNRTLGY
jgi:hypothetical protein